MRRPGGDRDPRCECLAQPLRRELRGGGQCRARQRHPRVGRRRDARRVRFPDNADVWQPLAALDSPADARLLKVYGRLSPHANIPEAQTGVAGVLTGKTGTDDKNRAIRSLVVPINNRYNGDITNPAWIAFITVGVVLVLI